MADQRRDPEQRPSPEALLEAARREERRVGKLRIFIGAAPGVGKTYQMLQQAQARKKDGYDIVIGIVGSFIGLAFSTVLLEGLVIIGVNQYWQEVAIGVVLVAAVYLDQFRRRLRQRA